ncbi:hypothetical protein SAMN05421595_2995 [Austwickia chelonae]|nr:hypothetical protein SAMN05421595_2995 [Austwickia chelonae]
MDPVGSTGRARHVTTLTIDQEAEAPVSTLVTAPTTGPDRQDRR